MLIAIKTASVACCPFCREGEVGEVSCGICGTEAHSACVSEFGGGCPTFGCKGRLESPSPVTMLDASHWIDCGASARVQRAVVEPLLSYEASVALLGVFLLGLSLASSLYLYWASNSPLS